MKVFLAGAPSESVDMTAEALKKAGHKVCSAGRDMELMLIDVVDAFVVDIRGSDETDDLDHLAMGYALGKGKPAFVLGAPVDPKSPATGSVQTIAELLNLLSWMEEDD